ncbi:MAG: DUF192 domain-containing protein [Petrotogales bacterium]
MECGWISYSFSEIDLCDYDVIVADNLISRFVGLMFQELGDGEIMLFKFSDHVNKNFHTYFMLQSIDMIFLDQDFEVVELREDVGSFQRVQVRYSYMYVIEAAPGFILENNIIIDSRLNLGLEG